MGTKKALKDIILDETYKDFLKMNKNSSFSPNRAFMELYTDVLIAQCGYYADVFAAVGCPADMDETETKPSDYIKKELLYVNIY